eukprot:scaffold1942_cov351-Prasinococcus_capsulatus_cf.AAC.1
METRSSRKRGAERNGVPPSVPIRPPALASGSRIGEAEAATCGGEGSARAPRSSTGNQAAAAAPSPGPAPKRARGGRPCGEPYEQHHGTQGRPVSTSPSANNHGGRTATARRSERRSTSSAEPPQGISRGSGSKRPMSSRRASAGGDEHLEVEMDARREEQVRAQRRMIALVDLRLSVKSHCGGGARRESAEKLCV